MSGFGERVWFRSSWALSRFQRCLELYVRLAGVSTNSISTSHRASVTSAHHSDTLTQRTRAMSTNLPQLDRPTAWGSSHYSIKRGFLERPNWMTDSKPECFLEEICTNRPSSVSLRRRLSKLVSCRRTSQFQSRLNQIWLCFFLHEAL